MELWDSIIASAYGSSSTPNQQMSFLVKDTSGAVPTYLYYDLTYNGTTLTARVRDYSGSSYPTQSVTFNSNSSQNIYMPTIKAFSNGSGGWAIDVESKRIVINAYQYVNPNNTAQRILLLNAQQNGTAGPFISIYASQLNFSTFSGTTNLWFKYDASQSVTPWQTASFPTPFSNPNSYPPIPCSWSGTCPSAYTYTIHGSVYQANNSSNGLSGWSVLLNGNPITTTDSSGHYSFTTTTPNDTITVKAPTAFAEDYSYKIIPTSITPSMSDLSYNVPADFAILYSYKGDFPVRGSVQFTNGVKALNLPMYYNGILVSKGTEGIIAFSLRPSQLGGIFCVNPALYKGFYAKPITVTKQNFSNLTVTLYPTDPNTPIPNPYDYNIFYSSQSTIVTQPCYKIDPSTLQCLEQDNPSPTSIKNCPSDATGTYPECKCTQSGYTYDSSTNTCVKSTSPSSNTSPSVTTKPISGVLPQTNDVTMWVILGLAIGLIAFFVVQYKKKH